MSNALGATLPATPAAGSGGAVREGVAAARNALTLGATMLAGMAISMGVRLVLVRILGPDAFGELRFAENAAELLFVGLTLGVDTLLRKEAAVDAAGARQYLRAITFLRILGGGILLAAIATALSLTGAQRQTVTLFGVLAVAQFGLVLNNSYTALEHASGQVRWIAGFTLRFKVLWAALALLMLWLVPSPMAFALVFLAVEGAKLARLGSRHGQSFLGSAPPDLKLAARATVASLPFFVNYLAYSLYARLGVWWLGGTASAQEVGWYGSASTLAAVAMLGMPLISWVLVPATSRAGQAGEAGAASLIEGALRIALLVATPISVVVGLAAPFWVHLLFGGAYTQASGALQALAPTFTLAYVATVCSIGLIQQDRVRSLAMVSVAGLVVSVVLNAVLIPLGARSGPGGAATGAAWAALGTEVLVTGALLRLSRSSFRLAAVLPTASALLVATAAAAGVARLIPAPWPGACMAGVAFALVVWASGAVTPSDVRFFRSVLNRTRS